LPPLLFYLLVFIDKPGYLLNIVPPVCIIIARAGELVAARGGRNVSRNKLLGVLVGVNTLLCIAWFLLPGKVIGVSGKIQRPTALPQPPMSDYTWDVSLREVAVKDRAIDDLRALLDHEHKNDFPPDTTILVAREYGSPNWRRLHYYFPAYHTYWLIDNALAGMTDFGAEMYVAHNNQVTSASGLSYWFPAKRPPTLRICLPPGIHNILWFIDPGSPLARELLGKANATKVAVGENGSTILYTNLEDTESLTAGSFAFARCN
jgi:hypothetical protein